MSVVPTLGKSLVPTLTGGCTAGRSSSGCRYVRGVIARLELTELEETLPGLASCDPPLPRGLTIDWCEAQYVR